MKELFKIYDKPTLSKTTIKMILDVGKRVDDANNILYDTQDDAFVCLTAIVNFFYTVPKIAKNVFAHYSTFFNSPHYRPRIF